MTDPELRDRRFRAAVPGPTAQCRLCWKTFALEPQHIETTDQHVYVRCPSCQGSFPIRHSDIESLPGHEARAAG